MDTEQDNRFIKITLNDAIIKATDKEGEERLRLAVKVDGKEVLARFPTYGNWDFYVQDLAKLMVLLSQTAQDIEIDPEEVPEKYYPQWAYVMSHILRFKECRELIDRIFFDYLRPTVEGVEDVRAWCNEHMDASHLFYMFVSIMYIESWFKKKSLAVLEATFPSLIRPSLKDTSQKSMELAPKISEPGQAYAFD